MAREQAAIKKAMARQNELRLKEEQMKFKYETQLRFEWQEDLIEEKREKLDGKHRNASQYLEK